VREGKVKNRRLLLADWPATFDQLVDFLQNLFFNPNLAAGSAHLGRYVLEKVELIATALFMSDGGFF
jgi:hypothetical protein